MRLTNLADYAVVTMTAAARHSGTSRVSASELAKETSLPAPTVQKLVSKLTAAGLLHSERGARGGLQLARPATTMTLTDIIEAVEGPITLTHCSGTVKCEYGYECYVKPHWPVINQAVRDALSKITLSRLMQ